MTTHKVYGYLKIVKNQDSEHSKSQILLKANELKLTNNIEWIEEQITGTKFWKNKELIRIMEKVQPGDTIITNEITGLAKKYLDIIKILAEFATKQIKIYFTNSDIKIDQTIEAQMIILAQTISTQIKKEHMTTKNKKIQQTLHKQGTIGRKEGSVLDKEPENINKVKEMLEKDVKLKVIAKELNCTTVTIRKFIREHKLKEFKNKEHKLKNEPDVILTLEQQDEIKKELCGSNKPKYKEMAKKYNLSVHKLNYLIRAYKLKSKKE